MSWTSWDLRRAHRGKAAPVGRHVRVARPPQCRGQAAVASASRLLGCVPGLGPDDLVPVLRLRYPDLERAGRRKLLRRHVAGPPVDRYVSSRPLVGPHHEPLSGRALENVPDEASYLQDRDGRGELVHANCSVRGRVATACARLPSGRATKSFAGPSPAVRRARKTRPESRGSQTGFQA
jgi:hypothetical protein